MHNHLAGTLANCIDCHGNHVSTNKTCPMHLHKQGHVTPSPSKVPGGGPPPAKGKVSPKTKGKEPVHSPASQAIQQSPSTSTAPATTASQRPTFKASEWKIMCKKPGQGLSKLVQWEGDDVMDEDDNSINGLTSPQSQ